MQVIMKLNLNKTTKLSIDINIINLKIGDIMAKIGYARVSSKNQNLDRQIESLQGVSKLFSDKCKLWFYFALTSSAMLH